MRSVQNQLAWAMRAQWVLAGVIVITTAAFLLLGWRPGFMRQRALSAEIERQSRQLQQNQARAQNLPILAAEVAKLEARLQRFNKKLPRTAELGEFIRELTQASQQYNLRKLVHQPGQIRRAELYGEIPITMNFEGDFMSVFNFLRQMEEMQRLTRVKSLQMRCRDGKLGQVDVSMAMNIYFSEL